jgi:hypothetical protein
MFARTRELERQNDALRQLLAQTEQRATAAEAHLRQLTDSKTYIVLPRDTYEGLTLDLATARSEKAMLETRVAVAQNNFDWLASQMNELRIERAALLERTFQLHVPVPTIARESLEGADTNYAPSAEGRPPANLGDVLAIAREAAERAAKKRTDEASMESGELSGIFEDERQKGDEVFL